MNKIKANKKQHKPLTYEKRRALWGVIFLSPWLIGLVFFFLTPIIKTLIFSFRDLDMQLEGEFIGFENYRQVLFVNPTFWSSIVSIVKGALINTPAQVFIALFIAILLEGNYKGKGFFRMVFFIPIILATGITRVDVAQVSLGSLGAESSKSILNTKWLDSIIMSSSFLSGIGGYASSYVSNILNKISEVGVQTLICMAGLQNISPSLYECAKIEGCSKFESFCKITLPMISPMLLVSMVFSLADNFAKATIIDVIKNETFSANGSFGRGAAMSFVYFVVSSAVIGLLMWIVSKGVFYYDKD